MECMEKLVAVHSSISMLFVELRSLRSLSSPGSMQVLFLTTLSHAGKVVWLQHCSCIS